MKNQEFGRAQMRILQALWNLKRATAREIVEEINEYEPIAHNTVQILLRTLEDKKAVAHDVDGRAFIYYPLVQEDNAVQNAMSEFVNRVFNGSIKGMISYLARSGHIPPEEKKLVADTLISRMFDGSAEELVTYLVENNYLSPETLKKISEKKEEKKAER